MPQYAFLLMYLLRFLATLSIWMGTALCTFIVLQLRYQEP